MATIYHNPRCSKSRQALALLEENGVAPKVIEYLKEPLTEQEIADILSKLGLQAKEIIRTGEQEYKTLSLKDKDLTDKALIALIAKHPKLLQRPIVVMNDRAVVGRPPENVLTLL